MVVFFIILIIHRPCSKLRVHALAPRYTMQWPSVQYEIPLTLSAALCILIYPERRFFILGEGDRMPKFKSQEDYDNWKFEQARKRQGAKDIEKLDAERPVYLAEKKKQGIDVWYIVMLLIIIAAVLYFWLSGR
jgi:hypothetical protein